MGKIDFPISLMFLCVCLIFISACRDKYERIDKFAAECSAGNQKACGKLADIARNTGIDSDVRRAAVNKLTDQTVLASLADDPWVGDEAVNKLTDPTILAGIVWEHGTFVFKRRIAFGRIAGQASQAEMAADGKDMKLRMILKLIAAGASLPPERKTDLLLHVLPAIRFLNDPMIVPLIGEIVSIETYWNKMSKEYVGDIRGSILGEAFTCRIKVQNLFEPISYSWKTIFPDQTNSLAFLPAHVEYIDLLARLFEKVDDQSLLADIAKKSKDGEVRKAAVEKLVDQVVLAYIADNDKDDWVRTYAMNRLRELNKK